MMINKQKKQIKMMTIRQVANTGLLPEHTLRLMAREGRLPCMKSGNRILVNRDKLEKILDELGN